MAKYIVRLHQPYDKAIGENLTSESIEIVFSDSVLKDLIIIQTEIPFADLIKHKAFRSVEKERFGTVDV